MYKIKIFKNGYVSFCHETLLLFNNASLLREYHNVLKRSKSASDFLHQDVKKNVFILNNVKVSIRKKKRFEIEIALVCDGMPEEGCTLLSLPPAG